MKVAVDSQCYTYLISALQGVSAPNCQLADQKVALARVFFYSSAPYVPETVRSEYLRIADESKLQLHNSWGVLFPDLRTLKDHTSVMLRVQGLLAEHRKLADCQIVAECELGGIDTLLSYDNDLINRLQNNSTLSIIKPVEHWNSLSVMRGTQPTTIPAHGNPLALQTWWAW